MGNCGPGVPAAKDGTNTLICLLYVSKHLPDHIKNFSNFGTAYEELSSAVADEGPVAAPCGGFKPVAHVAGLPQVGIIPQIGIIAPSYRPWMTSF